MTDVINARPSRPQDPFTPHPEEEGAGDAEPSAAIMQRLETQAKDMQVRPLGGSQLSVCVRP